MTITQNVANLNEVVHDNKEAEQQQPVHISKPEEIVAVTSQTTGTLGSFFPVSASTTPEQQDTTQ